MADEVILKPKTKKEDNMVTFSIRINKDIVQKYDDMAGKANYSRNELISIALKHYIDVVKFEEIPAAETLVSAEYSDKSKKLIKKKIPVKKDKK